MFGELVDFNFVHLLCSEALCQPSPALDGDGLAAGDQIPASKKEKNEKVTSNAVKIKQVGNSWETWVENPRRVSHTAFPRPPGTGWGALGHVCWRHLFSVFWSSQWWDTGRTKRVLSDHCLSQPHSWIRAAMETWFAELPTANKEWIARSAPEIRGEGRKSWATVCWTCLGAFLEYSNFPNIGMKSF